MTTEIDRTEIRKGDKIRVWEGPRETEHYTERPVVDFTVAKVDSLKVWYADWDHAFFDLAKVERVELLERPEVVIKVGDRVRRENVGGVTIEFVVNRIDLGLIYPAYGVTPGAKLPGVGYRPDGFEVIEPA